jgi:hypothetical protein
MASRLKVQGGSHRHEHLSMVGPRPNSGGSGMRGGVGARERSASSIRRTFNAERPDIRLRKVAEQLVHRFGRLGQTHPRQKCDGTWAEPYKEDKSNGLSIT